MCVPDISLQQSNYRPNGQNGRHASGLTECVGCGAPPGSTANNWAVKGTVEPQIIRRTVRALIFLTRVVVMFAKRDRKSDADRSTV